MSNRRKLRLASLNGSPVLDDDRPGAAAVKDRDYPDRGALNAYQCEKCKTLRLIEHADKGVTPMFMDCPREDCDGVGHSLMYPNQAGITPALRKKAKWEWYRPSNDEFKELNPEAKKHVIEGGLLLREKTK